MDIPEEDNQQIAKRKAIQAVMRDASVTAQEKQRKIQEIMSKGAPAQPGTTSATQPSSTEKQITSQPDTHTNTMQPSADVPSPNQGHSRPPAMTSREAIQNIMRDSSLTPLERQARVQEIMANGVPQSSSPMGPSSNAAPVPFPSPTPVPPPPEPEPRATEASKERPATTQGTSRETIQAIMRDMTLTPQERQLRIQQIMAGGKQVQQQQQPPQQQPPEASQPEPEPQPLSASQDVPPAAAPTQAPVPSRAQLIQALMRDPSISPQEKQRRIQEIMASGGQPPQPAVSSPAAESVSAPTNATTLLTQTGQRQQASTTPSKEAIQTIMNDSTLSAQEKQQRIRDLMGRSSTPIASTSAPVPLEPSRSMTHQTDAGQSKRRVAPAATTPGAVAATADTLMAKTETGVSQPSLPGSRPTMVVSESKRRTAPAATTPGAVSAAPSGAGPDTMASTQARTPGAPGVSVGESKRRIVPAATTPGAVSSAPGDGSAPNTAQVDAMSNSTPPTSAGTPISSGRVSRRSVVSESKRRIVPAATTPGAVSSTPTSGGSASIKAEMNAATQPPPASLTPLNQPAAGESKRRIVPAATMPGAVAAIPPSPASPGAAEFNTQASSQSQVSRTSTIGSDATGRMTQAEMDARSKARAARRSTRTSSRVVPPAIASFEQDAMEKAGASPPQPPGAPGAVATTGGNRFGKAPRGSAANAPNAAERLRQLENDAVHTSTADAVNRKVASGGGGADNDMAATQAPSFPGSSQPMAPAAAVGGVDPNQPNLVRRLEADLLDKSGATPPAARAPDNVPQNRVRQLEADLMDKTGGPETQAEDQSPMGFQDGASSFRGPPRVPSYREGPAVVSETHAPQAPIGVIEESGQYDTEQAPPTEDVPYAGLRVDPNTVEGGQVEAYVADNTIAALGVATVMDEEEEKELEEKKQKQYLRIGICAVVLIIIAIVVPAVVVGGGKGGDVFIPMEPTMVPSAAPSPMPSSTPTTDALAKLMEAIRVVYDDDDSFFETFGNLNSPQYKAALWAADEDLFDAGDPSNTRMINRYALATIYFSLNGDKWLRCGRGSTSCGDEEWLSNSNECTWMDVECTDVPTENTITELFFGPFGPDGNNMVGSLPFEVALLPELKTLVISGENLIGTIPEGWKRMSKLENLLLGSNGLSGTFPVFMLEANPLLGTLHIPYNKFNGTIPSTISGSSLADLRLHGNDFVGTLPSEIIALENLRDLRLNENKMEGELPRELFQLPNLFRLHLSDNAFNGTLPDDMSAVSNLRYFSVHNTEIGGTLPAGLFNLVNLFEIFMSGANFTGTLPDSFSRLANATKIWLHDNMFTGTIPGDAFAALTRLNNLTLDGNDLSGSVSQNLCERTGTGFFDLKELTVDCDVVACDCCICNVNRTDASE